MATMSKDEIIAVAVKGATLIAIPSPSTRTSGKFVVQYEQPIPGLGNNANQAAAINGPATSGSFAPYRSTSPPDQRDSRNLSRRRGSNAAPACAGE